MRLRAIAAVPATLALAGAIAAGCIGPTPTPSPSPTPSPRPTAPRASPTPAPAITPAAAPSGTTLVDVPEAGARLPVPGGWEVAGADALGDPDRRAGLIARYPGADALLAAAAEMGDRAVPALVAFDASVAGTAVPLAPNIAVLVAQPSVSGPLLDLVAGFIGGGFKDAFGAEETSRERLATPLGDAVRLEYALAPRDGVAFSAVEYVIGAPAGTLLVSVLGPADVVATLDPDALVGAMTPMS
jgi:hypothetical protein